jgi:hypothetical protein
MSNDDEEYEVENPFQIPENTICAKCSERAATEWWSPDGVMAVVHGMCAAWCLACCLTEQLAHARKVADKIPQLEAELAEALRKR